MFLWGWGESGRGAWLKRMRRIGSGFEPNRDTKDPQDANICIDNISLMSKLESQYEFIDLDPKIVWGLLLSGAFGWGSDWGDGDGLGGAGGAGCFGARQAVGLLI